MCASAARARCASTSSAGLAARTTFRARWRAAATTAAAGAGRRVSSPAQAQGSSDSPAASGGIGRESCRGRGEISGGGGDVKKKKKDVGTLLTNKNNRQVKAGHPTS